MKKILIFNAGVFIYGAERGLLNLLKVLRDNFEVVVVLPSLGPLIKKLKELNIKVKVFPLPVLIFSWSPLYYFRFVILSAINIVYFFYYVVSRKIDIVYTNSLILFFPSLVAKLTRKKHVWHIREFFGAKLINQTLGSWVNKFSDEIICQSETIKDKLFLPRDVKVIYEPLARDNYKFYDYRAVKKEFHLPLDSRVISLVSRIHPLKGQYEFIWEMKDTLQARENLFILIAGDITPATLRNRLYKGKIENFIKKNNLKNVVLLGFKEDVGKIFSISDICVFPFLREEPFGISVAEALSFGCLTFFSKKSGGGAEVYKIFNKGEDFEINGIIKTISEFGNLTEKKNLARNIPFILSWEKYKSDILHIVSYMSKLRLDKPPDTQLTLAFG